jgi:hypothetical protein
MNTTNAMISTYNIDTLQFSKRMQKVGMKPEMAEELAEALRETHTNYLENLATKSELKNEIELAKKDIIIKLGGMITIGVAILAALIKF